MREKIGLIPPKGRKPGPTELTANLLRARRLLPLARVRQIGKTPAILALDPTRFIPLLAAGTMPDKMVSTLTTWLADARIANVVSLGAVVEIHVWRKQPGRTWQAEIIKLGPEDFPAVADEARHELQ